MEGNIPLPNNTERLSKEIFYDLIVRQIESLLSNERDPIANMANVAAFLYESLEEVNWTGFYRFIKNELLLGPFQGRVACVHIGMGSGVCGTAAVRRKTLIVANVHEFSGHIACDTASNSEIVIPMVKNKKLIGVLDVDSPQFNRFDDGDAKGLERVVKILLDHTAFK